MALTDNSGSPAQETGDNSGQNSALTFVYAAGAVVSLALGIYALWNIVKGKGGG